jgi:hypothetical protein
MLEVEVVDDTPDYLIHLQHKDINKLIKESE